MSTTLFLLPTGFSALIAEQQPFFEVGLRVLADYLPKSDAELHQWLTHALAENVYVFDRILHARDKLDLSVHDDFGDFMEVRAARERRGDESEAFQEAQAKLEKKAEEVRPLKELVAAITARNRFARETGEARGGSVDPEVGIGGS